MNGKQIFVYKIRTMHPYSEYLQEFIYDRNKLSEGGNLKMILEFLVGAEL